MRTTLDIDDDILVAAKELAAARQTTAGRVLSELARQAFTSYEECIALDPEMTEVHRQLGLLYYQLHQIARAREAFARYLALRPDAPDAARVREYLGESDP